VSKRAMSDLEFLRELTAVLGVPRAVTVLGYCVLLVVSGCETRAEMLASPLMARRTKYMLLADLRRFRDAMIAKGYTEFTPDTDEAAVAVLLERVGAAA